MNKFQASQSEACDLDGILVGSKAHILLLNDIIKKDCWENVHRQEEYELFPCILLLCTETFPD